MSDPVQLTPDALESLLAESDDEAFAAFLADLYERTGRDTERQGAVVTTTTPDGDRERLLAWIDDRSRLGRLFGGDTAAPDVDAVDAVVTPQQDAGSAAAVAEEIGAAVLDTADLHDRLLYAMEREACRDLCRDHFGREVEPRPAPEAESSRISLGALARPRVALIAVVVCGLLVVGAAGLPGSGTPGEDVFTPGNGSGTDDATMSDPVTPVGGGVGETSTPTPPQDTPLPPLSNGAAMLLDPCPDEVGDDQVLCLPPRPFSADQGLDVTAGSTASSLSGTFGNPYSSDISHASLRIETPPDWESRPVTEPPFESLTREHVLVDRLAPGESGNVSWVVTPPETAEGGRYNVTLISEWTAPEYDGPESTDLNAFRVRRNYTYRVRPAECRGVEPCSLLAGDPNGSDPFEAPETRAGSTNVTTGFLYNPYNQTITNGTITLDPPNEEWNVTPVSGTTFETLAPGASRPIAWNLTIPASADCAREYTLSGEATYELDVGALRPVDAVIVERITVPFAVTVSPRPSDGGVCIVPQSS